MTKMAVKTDLDFYMVGMRAVNNDYGEYEGQLAVVARSAIRAAVRAEQSLPGYIATSVVCHEKNIIVEGSND